jgi:uncharacterized protein
MTQSKPIVPSPCNSVCKITPSTGFCEGCFRTIDEIVAWGQMSNDEKQAVTEQLAVRKLKHAA